MKSPVISTVAVLVIIYCSIPCSSGELPDETAFGDNSHEELGELRPAATVDDANNGKAKEEPNDLFASGDEDEPFQGFTDEEIERNRIIAIDQDGNETVSTNEEVIQTFQRVRRGNSTFLRDEPHFTMGMERRSIIGHDSRYYRYYTQRNAPYSAIGYLSPKGCTAYLVGPRHLITAAHCVHPTGNTRAIYSASRFTFYLRRNCYSYGITYGVSEVLVYSAYRYGGSADYDIACLLLTSTVSNWMGYGFQDPMPTVSGEICGYPGDKRRSFNCFYCSWCGDAQRLTSGWFGWSKNDKRLQYTCDTYYGMSGSPVLTDDHDSTSRLYSYGVHTQGTGGSSHNKGVRINRDFFYDICRWKCNTGARCSALC